VSPAVAGDAAVAGLGLGEPPQDRGAEQAVLGGMLLSKDAVADVVEVLRGTDFYRPQHQVIFEVVQELFGRGEPADPVSVCAELTRRGELTRVGGGPYLHTLIAAVPTAANAGYYAQIVAERAVLRRLVAAGTRIVQLGQDAAAGLGGEVTELVDRAQAEIYQVTGDRAASDLVAVPALLGAAMQELESIQGRGDEPAGIGTGLTDLDGILHGLRPGQLVVVAGRPAMGKSVLALGIARACALRAGSPAALFSLEMSRSELMLRLLAGEAGVPLELMLAGGMTDTHWARVGGALAQLSGPEACLFIDDSPGLTLTEVRAKARRRGQRGGLGLVVVDYLQLLVSGRRVDNRQQEVAEFSRGLKLLAKDLGVPVVAVSQLNRNSEARQDKRPHLGDLRESGAIEADADVVVLVHRPDAYDADDRPGEADLIVAKNRNGPTGTATVAFLGATVEFRDLATGAGPGGGRW
jgi:replicative DNA helicase